MISVVVRDPMPNFIDILRPTWTVRQNKQM